jgi:hypothetical protein
MGYLRPSFRRIHVLGFAALARKLDLSYTREDLSHKYTPGDFNEDLSRTRSLDLESLLHAGLFSGKNVMLS